MLAEKVGMDVGDVEEELYLREDLGLSASDIADLISQLKTELDIEIPEEEVTNLVTVSNLLEASENYGQEF